MNTNMILKKYVNKTKNILNKIIKTKDNFYKKNSYCEYIDCLLYYTISYN